MLPLIFFLTLFAPLHCGDEKWFGKWFPKNPENVQQTNSIQTAHESTMGVYSSCDNANDKLIIDFNTDNYVDYLICNNLINQTDVKPNYSTEPIMKEYTIPPMYIPPHKCMNESITYDVDIPTFGAHRPIWLKYGEYLYAPPQRWLHNIEHGAIVLLYHPCADSNQLNKLKIIVKNCLFRHVITRSDRVSIKRPFVLVSWGKSLEMSVVEPELVLNFIKENALHGPEKNSQNGGYDKLLISNAKIVSNADDGVICPTLS